MPDIINLLPDSIANQIAAGEVVQRPASVVKELLENAIDAGSDEIKLLIKDSGKTLIQVVDNGSGMTETDARMSFERHATSKINAAEDLFRIKTMGFRGEALASIASVASVELKTRRSDDGIGTEILIEGGKLVKQEPVACNQGTSIKVRNLFFNIPVRKNFLKSDSVEYRHISDEFTRIALSYPDKSFYLFTGQSEVYHLQKSSLRQRIIALFGKRFDKNLVPIEESTPIVKISGFIGKPEYAKKTRGEQYMFVNKRFIKNPYFHHAILSAFENLIQTEYHPFYTIFMEIPPEKIDVNVHPTKTEVKFEDDKAIYSIVKAAVKRALAQANIGQTLDFEQEAFMNSLQTESRMQQKEQSELRFDIGHEVNQIPRSNIPTIKASEDDWKKLLEVLHLEKTQEQSEKLPFEEDAEIPEQEPELIRDEAEEMKLMQIHRKYIFTPIHSGIMLVHQQYAHQRILYESFLAKMNEQKVESQKQMFPEVIECSESDFNILAELKPHLERTGFEFEVFGPRAYLIQGIPAGMQLSSPKSFIEQLIEDYKNSMGNQRPELKNIVALGMAQKSCKKTGEILSKEEMSLMIDKLFACSNPYYSPNGKPTLLKIDFNELNKKFE